MAGPATIPTSAVAVTTCPATPSVMPKSPAIRGSRLAGRNSLVTRVKMATIRAMTPGQPDPTRVGTGVSTTVTVAVLVMGPAPQEDMPQGRERTGSERRDGARRTLAGQAKNLTIERQSCTQAGLRRQRPGARFA